jgi:hypothetical protein
LGCYCLFGSGEGGGKGIEKTTLEKLQLVRAWKLCDRFVHEVCQQAVFAQHITVKPVKCKPLKYGHIWKKDTASPKKKYFQEWCTPLDKNISELGTFWVIPSSHLTGVTVSVVLCTGTVCRCVGWLRYIGLKEERWVFCACM